MKAFWNEYLEIIAYMYTYRVHTIILHLQGLLYSFACLAWVLDQWQRKCFPYTLWELWWSYYSPLLPILRVPIGKQHQNFVNPNVMHCLHQCRFRFEGFTIRFFACPWFETWQKLPLKNPHQDSCWEGQQSMLEHLASARILGGILARSQYHSTYFARVCMETASRKHSGFGKVYKHLSYSAYYAHLILFTLMGLLWLPNLFSTFQELFTGYIFHMDHY